METEKVPLLFQVDVLRPEDSCRTKGQEEAVIASRHAARLCYASVCGINLLPLSVQTIRAIRCAESRPHSRV